MKFVKMKGNCNGQDRDPNGKSLTVQMYVKGQTYEVGDELAKDFMEVGSCEIVNPKESDGPKDVVGAESGVVESDEKQMDLNPENKMQDDESENK